ncbi:hypothetical protein [Tenacibaculum insulae]|uniref:hypothetical protein n=1 Tax=Tenacibaculum insulae TaxID=2029677 RepID=UPI003AB4AE40
MTVFKAILNIIEWNRILYFSFIIFLAKYSFLYGFGFETVFSFLDTCLFTVSCIFMYAAIYLLSYYYNNKSKNIVVQNIKHLAFTVLIFAFFLGTYLSFKINKPYFSLVYLLCFFSVLFYSKKVHEKSFTSSLIKSFTLPFTIIGLWWIDTPINLTPIQWELFFNLQFITIIYLILSFLSTLSEQLIINISNINNDHLNKRKTLPILLGRKRAKNVAFAIMSFSAFLIVLLAMYFKNTKYLFITIIVSNLFPQLYLLYFFTKTTTNKSLKSFLKTMRYFHVFGILGIIAIAYYFKYVI